MKPTGANNRITDRGAVGFMGLFFALPTSSTYCSLESSRESLLAYLESERSGGRLLRRISGVVWLARVFVPLRGTGA